MRHLCWLSVLLGLSCFAAPMMTPYQEWLEFKSAFAEEAAGPTGMYAIQDMLEIAPGETAYLRPGKSVGESRWSKNAHPAAVAKVEYRDQRATLSGSGIQATDLLQLQQPWQRLPMGLNVRVSVLRAKLLKVWLYNPMLVRQRKFKSLSYFPYDPQGVIKATFRRNDAPVAVSYLDSRESGGTMYVVGTIQLQIAGRPYDLKAYSYKRTWEEIDALLLLLKDRTSGKTSYGGGRVVDIHIPPGAPPQTVIVNFNMAYSFLCAHSDYYNCPLVLTNNIDAALTYGEKYPPLLE